MSQILKASALNSSYRITASYGYDTLTAVQQLSGYIQASTLYKDSASYGKYALSVDNFELPLPGDGTFRAYIAGHTATASTPCGSLSVTVFPDVYLYIKGTLRATLTTNTTSSTWRTATIASAILQEITSLSDIEVRASPRYEKDTCVDYQDDLQPTYYAHAYGKVMYFELEIPSSSIVAGLEMGCNF